MGVAPVSGEPYLPRILPPRLGQAGLVVALLPRPAPDGSLPRLSPHPPRPPHALPSGHSGPAHPRTIGTNLDPASLFRPRHRPAVSRPAAGNAPPADVVLARQS